MTAAYMPLMCQTVGPDLGSDLQQAAEARLRELGIAHPTEKDIASAIAREEGVQCDCENPNG